MARRETLRVRGDVYHRHAGSLRLPATIDESQALMYTESDFSESFPETDSKPRRRMSQSSQLPTRSQFHIWGALRTFIPVIKWIPSYLASPDLKQTLTRDLVVGVTLSFITAPSGMAHAMLADLPPIFGIYNAFVSTMMYGALGSAYSMSVRTCALPAMLFGEAVLSASASSAGLDGDGVDLSVAPVVALTVGLATVSMAVLRLGFIVDFVAPAVLSAFATTAAFLIGTSQVKHLFGLSIKSRDFVGTWREIIENIGDSNPATILLSFFAISFLLCSRRLVRWGPLKRRGIPNVGAALLVAITIMLSYCLDLSSPGMGTFNLHGVSVVGETPAGLPPLTLPDFSKVDPTAVQTLVVDGIIIAVINFVLAISIAKSFAAKLGMPLDAAQELRALGAINVAQSFASGFTAGGSFSGSAIVSSLGAKTMMHNFINSVMMGIILLALTEAIALLPKATLASIIVCALPRLVDFGEAKRLYAIKRTWPFQ